MSTKNKMLMLFLIIIFLTALVYRLYGLSIHNPPFWVDEFSTAKQANLILKYGLSVFANPNLTFEPHNFTTYFLVAGFFKLFGQNEWAARMPFVLIGSLVPLMVFILARKIYDTKTAIAAALLTTFSYFEITWSRQARGYVLVQLLILAAIFFYLKLQEKSRRVRVYLTLLVLTMVLGILTHAFFLIFLVALSLDLMIFHREILKTAAKRLSNYILLILILGLSYKTGLLTSVLQFLTSNPIKANNFWYYHPFLWREYTLITFLGFIGLIIALLQKPKKISLILIYLTFQLIFVTFMFSHYMTKYVSSIFPFLFIGTGFFIVKISELVIDQQINIKNLWKNRLKIFTPIFITLFILVNGDKFVIKPKSYYSLNKHFREIANIDYQKVYSIILNKGGMGKGETAVVETWLDRAKWYLGQDYQPLYIFRWKNEKLIIIGQKISRTPFFINEKGEKIVSRNSNLKLIEDISDLKKALGKYPKGFIFIDDASLPKDVIEFSEKNLKKELYLDHYPLDDNPYSIWPATLYSWGIN